MSNTPTPPRQETAARPLSPIGASASFSNDDLPSGSPSGKVVLIVLGCVGAPVAFVLLFHSLLGF